MADERVGIILTAKDEMSRPTERAAGGLSKLQGTVISANQALELLSRTVGAGIRAIRDLASEYIATGDKLGKMSLRLGISAQALDELGFVAERQGVRFESVTTGIQLMTRNVQDAARGIGEAKEAIADLGLNAEDLSRLELDQQFRVIADAIGGLDTKAQQVSASMDIFGRSGAELNQIFAASPGTIDDLIGRARELGSVTDDMAKRAEVAADRQADLERSIRNVRLEIADKFLAAVTDDQITRLTEMFGALGAFAGKTTTIIIQAAEIGGLFRSPLDKDNPFLDAQKKAFADRFSDGRPPDVSFDKPDVSFLQYGNGPILNPASDPRISTMLAGEAAAGGLGKFDVSGLIAAGETFQADFIEPIMEGIIDLSDHGGGARDAIDALAQNMARVQEEWDNTGARAVDAAFRAADAWGRSAAKAILEGENAFKDFGKIIKNVLADILGDILGNAAKRFIGGILSYTIGASLGAPGAPGTSRIAARGAGGGGGGQTTVVFQSVIPPSRAQMADAARMLASVQRESG